jgi:small-conductance mechanosensitive channel
MSPLFEKTLFTLGHSEITLGKVIAVAFLILVAQIVIWLTARTLQQMTLTGSHVSLSESGAYALSRIIRYVVWTIVIFMGLDVLDINLFHFAIIGGAIGVGIGFGLQNIFSNFISGIVLLLEQTLKVGDFVDLQSGVVGRVSEINIRYTRVTTNDSVDVIVPNSEFINGRVTNWTFTTITVASISTSAWPMVSIRTRCARPVSPPRLR